MSLSYNGSILHETLVDSVTSDMFERLYPLNLSAIVGGPTAFVGFTAAGFSNGSSDQIISDFHYTVPAPSAALALVVGVFALRRRR